MTDPWLIYGTLLIRGINAILWTLVCWRILKHDEPVPRVVRQLITTVIFLGMWVLTFGGAVPVFEIPGEVARTIYTIYTIYAGIIALGLLLGDDD